VKPSFAPDRVSDRVSDERENRDQRIENREQRSEKKKTLLPLRGRPAFRQEKETNNFTFRGKIVNGFPENR